MIEGSRTGGPVSGWTAARAREVFADAARLPPGTAAARLAAQGLPVLPLAVGGKRPLTRHGLTDASTDPAVVAAWWRRWPWANVGMTTGGAGFDVVDIDRRGQVSGFGAAGSARTAGVLHDPLLVVATPSQGVHLYYPAVPGRPQRSWSRPRAKVDFRGTGGYVLVPPSTIGDGRYRIIATSGRPVPVDATRLRDHLTPPPSRQAPRRVGPANGRAGGAAERLADWLRGSQEGNRNNALFWAACRCAEARVDPGEAERVLGGAAGDAGLDPREIAATIRSAYRSARPSPPAPRHGRTL